MKRDESNLSRNKKIIDKSSEVTEDIQNNRVFKNINKSIDCLETIVDDFKKKNDTSNKKDIKISPI